MNFSVAALPTIGGLPTCEYHTMSSANWSTTALRSPRRQPVITALTVP